MSSPDAFTTIEAALRAGWGSTTDIVFENEDYHLPGSPEHFLYVEVFGDFFNQASIGAETRDANLWREGGQVYLHVMTKNGIGSATARSLARQAIDILRGMDINGVTFRDASIGAGEPGRTFGNYFAMTATIDWERDE